MVPQFLDVESKIIGPISARQFVILLAMGLVMAVLYRIFLFGTFLGLGVPVFVLGVVFAFVRINGQPFHFFVLNAVQTFRRPMLRIWDKGYRARELKMLLKEEEVAPPVPSIEKAPLSTSRLQELSLIVNTGGMYRPED
jgi:hypothetical protein